MRFEFEGPAIASGACHCRACQYAAGGAPTYVVGASREAFKVTQGEARLFLSKGDSGADVARAFCPDCGTPLWSVPSSAQVPFIPVKVGALDDPSAFQPQFHIYVDAAQPWHHLAASAIQFPKAPPLRPET
ncbi:MAG TPA: GFA family protein [Phenylobacterium sp.]|nr:GFA family protein [Phenylobacterium sp.]